MQQENFTKTETPFADAKSSELLLPRNVSCWVVTDGKTGTENQCLGLAAALGITPVVKRVSLRAPWSWLTPYIRGFEKYAFRASDTDKLTPPWPDILIASGRRSLPASFYVKKVNPRTFVVQLQDPHCNPALFDMVVVPEHDQLRGTNVITTVGALNRVTPAIIADAADAQRNRFAHLEGPLVAVLIGGDSMAYSFTAEAQQRIIDNLQKLLRETSGSLLITTSRRTPAAFVTHLQETFADAPNRVWLWEGDNSKNGAENPYFAMLGLADHIVVTADSVSMISEAAVTGKPLYLIDLPGSTAKFSRFYDGLRQRGIIRDFNGTLAAWTYGPLLETQKVAQILVENFLKTRA